MLVFHHNDVHNMVRYLGCECKTGISWLTNALISLQIFHHLTRYLTNHCSDILGENPRLAYPHQRSRSIHNWRQIQHSLHGGLIWLDPTGHDHHHHDYHPNDHHNNDHHDDNLQIKYTQEQDAGIYECQVSTSTGTIQQQVSSNYCNQNHNQNHCLR